MLPRPFESAGLASKVTETLRSCGQHVCAITPSKFERKIDLFKGAVSRNRHHAIHIVRCNEYTNGVRVNAAGAGLIEGLSGHHHQNVCARALATGDIARNSTTIFASIADWG
eukprot:scaffold246468_cov40-Tisochrysis_lutea.AAC.1